MSLGKQIAVVMFALCAGALVGVLVLGWALSYGDVSHGADVGQFSKGILFAMFAGVFAIPAAILFGTPSFFLLRRVGLLRWWSVCAIGVAAGTLISAAGITPFIPWYMDVGLGFISALVSWLILVRSKVPLRVLRKVNESKN